MKSLKEAIQELQDRLAGEIGPRGGKIIGQTESGKPIYDKHDHPAHKDFTPKDHQDASQLHQYISLANKRKPTLHNYHWDQHEKHLQQSVAPPRVAAEVGPKGGHIVGKTKSGKPIYADPKHPAHQSYSPQERAEAVGHHLNHNLAKQHGFSDAHPFGHKTVHKHQNGSEAHMYHDGSWTVHGPGKYHVQGERGDHDRLEKALGVAGD